MPKASNTTDGFDPRVLSRNPYRGIILQIAKETGVTYPCVWGKLNRLHPNPNTVRRAQEIMRERDAQLAGAAV